MMPPAINLAPPHLLPLLIAARDQNVMLCIVPQEARAFSPPENLPTIVLVGDDLHEAKGPTAFHQQSVKRFAKRCACAVIVATAPIVPAYATAAFIAANGRRNVILVETQPKFEADWKAVLTAANPNLKFIICTLKPAGGIH